MNGLVFDIEEFAVYDGPGIRTAIFLKGCPLGCEWCHNPEGMSPKPTRVRTLSLCARCGVCDAVCDNPDECSACGKCARACPNSCIRIAGRWMEPEEAARRVLRNERLLALSGGGVTFSGGEPLMQPDFVIETARALGGVHRCIETSGYASVLVFERVIDAMDFIIMDIKIIDSSVHKRYTGVDNASILRNLDILISSGKNFRIRVPLIPTVNDTRENLRQTAGLIAGAKRLEKAELLRYNKSAGAKYAGAGMQYNPSFPVDVDPNVYIDIFKEMGIPCDVL